MFPAAAETGAVARAADGLAGLVTEMEYPELTSAATYPPSVQFRLMRLLWVRKRGETETIKGEESGWMAGAVCVCATFGTGVAVAAIAVGSRVDEGVLVTVGCTVADSG